MGLERAISITALMLGAGSLSSTIFDYFKDATVTAAVGKTEVVKAVEGCTQAVIQSGQRNEGLLKKVIAAVEEGGGGGLARKS